VYAQIKIYKIMIGLLRLFCLFYMINSTLK
jgi:hypothetical protein